MKAWWFIDTPKNNLWFDTLKRKFIDAKPMKTYFDSWQTTIKILFNADPCKPAQEVLFSRKKESSTFCFSSKTLITMYKQRIYSWQKLMKITWLKCHKQ